MKFSERIAYLLLDHGVCGETYSVKYLPLDGDYRIEESTGDAWVIAGDLAKSAFEEAGNTGLKFFLEGALETTQVHDDFYLKKAREEVTKYVQERDLARGQVESLRQLANQRESERDALAKECDLLRQNIMTVHGLKYGPRGQLIKVET